MRTFDELRPMVLELFDRLDTLAAGQPGTAAESAARTAAARLRLEEGRLTIAVCGEFKSGKSTLLSALLEEPGLFPDDTLPATNAVTVARWGATEHVAVTLRTGVDTTEKRVITRNEIAGYVTEGGNPNNEREVLLVEIETPNPKLASGLVFVDTPGVGGVLTEHTAVTLAFLPGADALLFVTDVEKPLLESESGFLRRAIDAAKLTDDVDSLVCVMTKIDQGDEYEVLYDEMKSTLADLTGRELADLVLIPVSAWQKLKHLDGGDEGDLADSNFPALEAALWEALGRRRARVLLGDGLRALQDRAEGCLAPIAAAEAAARDLTGRTLADLQRESQERREHLTRLAEDSKRWQPRLEEELKRAAKRMNAIALGRLRDNWTLFREKYVAEDGTGLLDEPERISEQLGADFTALLGGLLKLVRKEVADAVERFSVKERFTLAPPRITELPDLPQPKLPSGASITVTRTYPGAGMVVTRYTSMTAGIGGTIGSGLGALLGGAIGTILLPGAGTLAGAGWGASLGGAAGAAVAGLFGLRGSQQMVQAKAAENRRAEVIRLFSPYEAAQATYLQSMIALQFDEIRPSAVAELVSRLKQEKETVTNILARLGEDQRVAQQDLAAQQAAFAAERRPFDELLTELEEIARDVELLGSRDPAGHNGPRPPAAAAGSGAR